MEGDGTAATSRFWHVMREVAIVVLQGVALFVVTMAAVILGGLIWGSVFPVVSVTRPVLGRILVFPLIVVSLLLFYPAVRLGYQAGRRTGWGWIGGMIVGAEAAAIGLIALRYSIPADVSARHPEFAWGGAVGLAGVSFCCATIGGILASRRARRSARPGATGDSPALEQGA
jgi:hypothetical protein